VKVSIIGGIFRNVLNLVASFSLFRAREVVMNWGVVVLWPRRSLRQSIFEDFSCLMRPLEFNLSTNLYFGLPKV